MEFYICPDCLMWAANRDDSGASSDWPKNGERDYIGGFIPILDADGETDSYPFSTAECDGCGDRLAGTRAIVTR